MNIALLNRAISASTTCCALSTCLALFLSGRDAPAADPAAKATSNATISGIVRYRADPARPWRLSRYYIKDNQTGWLAEAVVALAGPSLAKASPAATPTTHHVDQMNFMFVPETIAVRAGDSVKFTNSDDSLHNVMTNDGGSPFNVNMAKGDEYVHEFTLAGGLAKPVRLGCVYHGGMRGWVYVFDHPFFRVTGADGRFELGQVPPGEYTLHVVHPAGRLNHKQTVTVKAGQNLNLEIVLEPAKE